MKSVNDMVEQVKEFPTLPTIYGALLDVISNPRSTVADVANIISQDQAAATKILKSVNSSIYGLQVRVDTISQAIFHLGFNEVKNLVIALSVIDIFQKTQSLPQFNVVDLWKHSIAVGVVTRLLGKSIGIKNLENYFLAGILHDIGKLFFLKNFNNEYDHVVKYVLENDTVIQMAESKVFGITHTVIGDMLAEKWKLPVSIRNAIKHHTRGLVDGKSDVQVCCVHIANIIARMMELGFPGDNLVHEPNIDTWNYLNFPPHTIISLMPQIKSDYQQSVSILLKSS